MDQQSLRIAISEEVIDFQLKSETHLRNGEHSFWRGMFIKPRLWRRFVPAASCYDPRLTCFSGRLGWAVLPLRDGGE